MQAPSPKTIGDLLTLVFPERCLTMRSQHGDRDYVLTPPRQAAIAVAAAVVLIWLNISLFSAISSIVQRAADGQGVRPINAAAADHAIVTGADDINGIKATDTPFEMAEKTERRHAALSMLLNEARAEPGAADALQPAFPALMSEGATPAMRITAVAEDQDRLVAAAADFARLRVARLRGVMALTGLDAFGLGAADASLHGVLITAHDARSLSAELGVGLDFARRVETAATDLFDLRALADKALRLPLARPVDSPTLSSGFGPRLDPISGIPHFHAGLDFPGSSLANIRATAPGVVVFTGLRSGYGATIEIDHGGGFWTRYAHLSRIEVSPGQHVARGERIGGMGSTGHSTGTHLHYEVWQQGRARDPGRFLRAGSLIQSAG